MFACRECGTNCVEGHCSRCFAAERQTVADLRRELAEAEKKRDGWEARANESERARNRERGMFLEAAKRLVRKAAAWERAAAACWGGFFSTGIWESNPDLSDWQEAVNVPDGTCENIIRAALALDAAEPRLCVCGHDWGDHATSPSGPPACIRCPPGPEAIHEFRDAAEPPKPAEPPDPCARCGRELDEADDAEGVCARCRELV